MTSARARSDVDLNVCSVRHFLIREPGSHICNSFASIITQQSLGRVLFFFFARWKESVQNVAEAGRPYLGLTLSAGAAGNQR